MGNESVRRKTIRHQYLLVKLLKYFVFEMAERVANARSKQCLANVEPPTLTKGRCQRGGRAMHARNNEDRRGFP
jgi:hypothetical protein